MFHATRGTHAHCLVLLLVMRCAVAIIVGAQANAGHAQRNYIQPSATRRNHHQLPAAANALQANTAGADYADYFASGRVQQSTSAAVPGKNSRTAEQQTQQLQQLLGNVHSLLAGFTPTTAQHNVAPMTATNTYKGDATVQPLFTPNYDYAKPTDYQLFRKPISDGTAAQHELVDNSYEPYELNNIDDSAYNNKQLASEHYSDASASSLQGYFEPATKTEEPTTGNEYKQPASVIPPARQTLYTQQQQQLYQQYKQQQLLLASAYATQLRATESAESAAKPYELQRQKRTHVAHKQQSPFSGINLPPISTNVQHNALSAQALAGIPLAKHTEIVKQIPVQHVQRLHVPYHQQVRIPIPNTQITTSTYPQPIHVPVTKTVTVPELRELRLPIQRVRAVPVERAVPYIVERRVPYRVERPVVTPVYYPMPIKVPVMRTVVHKIPHQRAYATLHHAEHALRI